MSDDNLHPCPNERHHYDMATLERPLCGAFQGEDAQQPTLTDLLSVATDDEADAIQAAAARLGRA